MIILETDLTNMLDEVKLLENIDDCFGYILPDNKRKGIFVQVVDYGEGKEYIIEANNIDDQECFEPCGEYNRFAKFGDYKGFITEVEKCIEDMEINSTP